ncbi:uncharacterized protein CCOS01_03288 [Colletotrichum costaricense]|uniref:Uncharacterized protein n=2 Tax=Colletotrichum acutatum species complex TaxID=2707335 RepID=A0AAI9Z4J3_9PEZI|nr:uncharacterized protein CCOS01_03288 [Colletotrichum costaricense]XP_060382270.1 uncharacterized protein CTAM01_07114 [Colletotrichum tamarilloi]KAK1499193.1 hypothetical protein CTAM01_07114 [Colletotrichum tamarilloi]KAK1534536.1 hypothetical protein CCOS01_03288 [Colletotrichum costaricense]
MHTYVLQRAGEPCSLPVKAIQRKFENTCVCLPRGVQSMTRPYIGKGVDSCSCPNLPVSYSPKLY